MHLGNTFTVCMLVTAPMDVLWYAERTAFYTNISLCVLRGKVPTQVPRNICVKLFI